MADDGERDRALAVLYLNLAKALKDNNYNATIIAKARLEKALKDKVDEERNPLYSHRKGRVVSYAEKVNESQEFYEDLMFDLSDNSKESIKTIKEFTAEEVINFNKRVVQKIKRNTKK